MAFGSCIQNDTVRAEDEHLYDSGTAYVFVAGGLSFLGRHLIPALIEAGYGVRSMAKTIEQRAQLRSLGCTTAGHGEPFSYEAVREAARGCIYAVHCASAFVHFDPSGTGIIAKSNNLVVSNIVQVCKDLNIIRLIVQSSEAVLFGGSVLSNVDEDCEMPPNPVGSCARSMQEVERLVLSANSRALDTVVVRPRLLWGRDDDVFLPSLLSRAKAGTLRLVGGGQHLTSTCHVANACRGILCALSSCRAAGQVYFLTDGEHMIFAKFVQSLLAASGYQDVTEATRRSIPLWAAKRLAMLAEGMSTVTNLQPQLTQAGIGLAGQEMTFSDSKARQHIGYANSTSVEGGLEEIRNMFLRRRAKKELGRQFQGERAPTQPLASSQTTVL